MAPKWIGAAVFCAAALEVEVPNEALLPTFFELASADALAELATNVASGTAEEPVVISTTSEAVVLNVVCAMEISLLLRS